MALYNDAPVDMMEIARRTTKQDVARQQRGAIKIVAPAKVNLLLAVGGRREDGYHKVENVMQAILLHDVVYMWPTATVGEVTCECVAFEELLPVDVEPERNLAVRAVRALATRLYGAPTAAPGLGIRIEKHIPAQAGLGGGSSDAAAALVGAARLWAQVERAERAAAAFADGAADGETAAGAGAAQCTPELLEEVARGIGADVAYFLRGGAALYTGAGEQFARQLASRKDAMVIIQPQAGLGTAEVYRAFDALLEQRGGNPDADLEAAQAALAGVTEAAAVPLMNSLQAPAAGLCAEVAAVIAWAEEQPNVTAVQMTGSGSAVFVCCSDFAAACKLAGGAKLQGWWARSTVCAPTKAAVVPA